MNALAPILILLLIAGCIGVLITAVQMWSVGGASVDGVGPRRPRSRVPTQSVIVPGQFRSLIKGEAGNWQRSDQWLVLVQHLDQLEVDLGGSRIGTAPAEYSAEWLDERITRLERIAGPLPAPLRPTPTTETSRLPWKRHD